MKRALLSLAALAALLLGAWLADSLAARFLPHERDITVVPVAISH